MLETMKNISKLIEESHTAYDPHPLIGNRNWKKHLQKDRIHVFVRFRFDPNFLKEESRNQINKDTIKNK